MDRSPQINLIDYIDQAVLHFGPDLCISEHYSEKVLEIFDLSPTQMRGIHLKHLLLDRCDSAASFKEATIRNLHDLFAWDPKRDTQTKVQASQSFEEKIFRLPTECRIVIDEAKKNLALSWRWVLAPEGRLLRIVLILEDVTEALAMQQSLELQNEKLLTLGEMTANFAHDIAAPTQLIDLCSHQIEQAVKEAQAEVSILFADQNEGEGLAIKQHFEQKFEDILQHFSSIYQATKRIDDLHRAVRNSFRQSDTKEHFSIHELLEECLVLARSRSHGYPMQVTCPKSFWITADRSRWGSMISNLINNACDALRDQPEPRLRQPAIHIEVSLGPTDLNFDFEDSGPGVPESLRERIFQSRFSTKKLGQGTGLGLSICKNLVEELGGTIQVLSSQKLGGACFHITVPLSSLNVSLHSA